MIKEIGLKLVPYSHIFADIASGLTSLQILSGFFYANDIRKKKSTVGFPVWPFLGGVVLSAIFIRFGFIIRDDAMIKVNFFGAALNVVFMMFYSYYTPNSHKFQLWKQIGLSILFTVGCFVYANKEDPSLIEMRFGMLITVIMVFLVASPLFSLGDIIKNKSTEGLPFVMIFFGTFVSLAWMLYGFSILNEIMVVQNAVLLIISVIELSLFVIYPSTSKVKDADKKKK